MLPVCIRRAPHSYCIATERNIACKSIYCIDSEDEQIGKKDHDCHSAFRGLLHIADDGDELHLGAVAIAEHRQRHEDVLTEDEGVQRDLKCVRLALLASLDAVTQFRVQSARYICHNFTSVLVTSVVGFLRQLTRIS